MTTTIINSKLMPGKNSNYLIAGNLCNAFALGEVGSTNDFFLVGAEPENESNYPLLTGNILDSEGKTLFRLVRNVLILNPGHCSRIFGDHVGYEIHDSNNNLIFKVQTKFEKVGSEEEMFITTIAANFYNKNGDLVFKANSGEPDERIVSRVKSVFGFAGAFGLVQDFNKEELDFLRIVFGTRGRIHQLVTGKIEDKELSLDGKAVLGAEVQNSKVLIKNGEFVLQNSKFTGCNFIFEEAAENIRQLVIALQNQKD